MFNCFNKFIKFVAGLTVISISMLFIVFVQAKVSSDAIAIRVIPNPEHYSALRWYKNQGFSGSPQSLIVDGYGAVRDGRAVYVNVANIAEDGNLYTNIYLILYNQEAGNTTQDIFSRILSHWEFNTNISDPGQCNESDSVVCAIDSDCPINEYCLSDKSEIIRDTKRLSDLADMNVLLEQYKEENNRYPSIRAGSYLPNKTISAWPSWQSILAQELKTVLSEDPINKLGNCGDNRFNSMTCWDEQNKEFADADLGDPSMNLPAESKIYVYSSVENGESYEICAVMESGYVSGTDSGACDSSESITIGHKVVNSQPVFKGVNLPIAYSGEKYLSLIEANDPDGDVLSWSINTSANAWTMWSSAPEMSGTEILSQKKISALSAGTPGDYIFTATINDNKGEPNSSAERDFTINVINPPPSLTAHDVVYTASTTNPLNYSEVTAKDYISNYPLAYSLSVAVPSNLTAGFTQLPNDDFYTFSLTGIFDPATESPIYPSKDYDFTITITDVFGVSAVEDFKITVLNNRPVANEAVLPGSIGCFDYYYEIIAIDPEGNDIKYFDNGTLPAGLSINQATGKISGSPYESGNYNITITFIDEYGAESEMTYNLEVVDEIFSINPISDGSIYVYPEGEIPPFYFGPLQFNATASVTTLNSVTYSLSNNPFWLIIDSTTGVIQGTPTDNENDPGSYTITVTAENNCGVGASTDFTLAVTANEWCGDGICQESEDCANCLADCPEGPDLDGDGIICLDNCPVVFNPTQADLDNDGVGDVCDCDFSYEGENILLRIQQDGIDEIFSPYAVLKTASDFYCYGCTFSTSADITEYADIVQSQRSEIFGYLDAINNKLNLGILHDKEEDGSAGTASFTLSGSSYNIIQMDDPYESLDFWNWGECCTDGAIIELGNLDQPWSVTINPNSFSGIDQWIIKSPCSEINLDMSKPVTISYGDCEPATCASLEVSCGIHNDNCDGTIDCGDCAILNTYCSEGNCICIVDWQDCDGNGSCECSGWCSGATCCASAVDVNIQVCADNAHETYFNGNFVSSAGDWTSIQSFNVDIISGKNVIAIKAWDVGDLYGISATLNWPECVNMTTADINKWKCTTIFNPEWTSINYDDSSWPIAVLGNPGTAGIRDGNALTVPQIWASGAGEGLTVYCRYTFGE